MDDIQNNQTGLDKNKKLEEIRSFAGLLNQPATIEKEIQKMARGKNGLLRQIFRSPISAGHFYEYDIFDHSFLVTLLAGLVMHQGNVIELPEEALNELDDIKDELPEWIDLEDEGNLRANLFGGYYTLNKSIHAINATGKSINQLLEEGITRNDRGPLKQAVKIDPVAIDSPQISTMLMLSDVLGKKDLRNDLHNALKKPRIQANIPYGKLRFIVWALQEEGLLKDMSEIERYQFLHKDLNLYKNNEDVEDVEDYQDSLNRMIRRWEVDFRT